MRLPYLILAFGLMVLGCKSPSYITSKSGKKVAKSLQNSQDFNTHFSGLVVARLSDGHDVVKYNQDKWFTPASNVKILTLHLALDKLSDTLVGLQYHQNGDTIVFRGAADPGLLHPDFHSDPIFDFLNGRTEKLFYLPSVGEVARYAPGWSWDDYPYVFQSERSDMPVYAQRFSLSITDGKLQTTPAIFSRYTEPNLQVRREEMNNHFTPELRKNENRRLVPFISDAQLIAELLADTLNRPIGIWTGPPPGQWTDVNGSNRDSLLIRMMHFSDNFIAEQLLLNSALTSDNGFEISKLIDAHLESNRACLPDPIKWKDGSGLSIYNKNTAENFVEILMCMVQDYGLENVLAYFPQPGDDGTLKRWKGFNQNTLYAKTGSLSNVACLSGFFKGDSGEWYVFSWLHNNYQPSSTSIWTSMQEQLHKWIDVL